MNKRPDGTAVLGLIGLAGLVIVGWVVLSAMGRSIGAEPWQVVMVAIGVVGGWVGKSVWTEATQGRTPVSGPSSDLPGATGAETPPIPPTGPSQTVRGLDRTPTDPPA